MAHDQLAVQFGEVYGRSPEMTLREHFAGQAMQGLLANSDLSRFISSDASRHAVRYGLIAEAAVCYADWLIAQLAKEPIPKPPPPQPERSFR